jgi:hypothetical protein
MANCRSLYSLLGSRWPSHFIMLFSRSITMAVAITQANHTRNIQLRGNMSRCQTIDISKLSWPDSLQWTENMWFHLSLRRRNRMTSAKRWEEDMWSCSCFVASVHQLCVFVSDLRLLNRNSLRLNFSGTRTSQFVLNLFHFRTCHVNQVAVVWLSFRPDLNFDPSDVVIVCLSIPNFELLRCDEWLLLTCYSVVWYSWWCLFWVLFFIPSWEMRWKWLYVGQIARCGLLLRCQSASLTNWSEQWFKRIIMFVQPISTTIVNV